MIMFIIAIAITIVIITIVIIVHDRGLPPPPPPCCPVECANRGGQIGSGDHRRRRMVTKSFRPPGPSTERRFIFAACTQESVGGNRHTCHIYGRQLSCAPTGGGRRMEAE